VDTCKIKHLQKCFRAVDFPRLCQCHGHKNVVEMFYFTCNHGLKDRFSVAVFSCLLFRVIIFHRFNAMLMF